MERETTRQIFENKTILITGGTGSLGKGLLKRIEDAKEIRIFSRSEIGQNGLRMEYPNVKFILGDVKDYHSVRDAVRGVDIVIHAAAFKYLNLGEIQARECALTNVLGSINVIDAVKNEKTVEICVGISTDKVAYARNVYGCSKHIMEKLFYEADRNSKTNFCCVRYGNVKGTNGSVFEIWKKQIEKGEPLGVTDSQMTRFFFELDDAIDLIFYAIANTQGGETFVRLMRSYNIMDLASKLSDNVKIIGLRPGEKLHETLIG
ncbi:MAG: polysaccharide biosynthesis protein, partial [Nanoarchaeota archaeon]